ncbi:YkgJ family cysteine cluster protein [bacterium]|jgi:Fe-S-cluster containining protein|nr:YkgJ family cysteine cluster protein [bacterium]MBT7088046.1 YkgJ family cysteine cluster protein [bacterium]
MYFPNFFFCGIYFLYLLNDRTFKREKIADWLWWLSKNELFYLAGDCKKDGDCCCRLDLYHNQQLVDTQEKYDELVKSNYTYKRFVPAHTSNKKIAYFNCILLKNGTCQDYSRRPAVCKNFPFSYFLKHSKLPSVCGYTIELKKLNFKIRNKSLQNRIQNMLYLEQERKKSAK